MKTTEYITKVIHPDIETNWLTQKKVDNILLTSFSKKVFLAVNESADNWIEITDEEKKAIEDQIKKITEETVEE